MAPPKGKGNAVALSALKNMMAAKQAAEAEQQRLEQEEAARIAEEERKEEERLAAEEKERAKRKDAERKKKEELKKAGKLLTKSEKERAQRNKLKLEQLLGAAPMKIEGAAEGEEGGKKKKPVYERKKKVQKTPTTDVVEQKMESDPEDDVVDDWENALTSSDGSDSDSESDEDATTPIKEVTKKMEKTELTESQKVTKQTDLNSVKKTTDKDLRSPICCILGHVDTGKTKLLDKIRQTNVQEGEAGGITQQIGATYFPIEAIKEKTAHLETGEFLVPGLLIIDTPGHESFTNLRSRGSSLCNIAILVVDIMHGLEPQTLESLGLLKQRKTPFIVALNKVDRLYGWKSMTGVSFEDLLEKQAPSVKAEFEERLSKTMLAFAEQGLNAKVSFRNDDMRRCVSLVPTSAITGDGVPDMLSLLIKLTQSMMSDNLRYLSTLQCTVLEVKMIEGLGTTIDVILSNGVLREGDRIAVCGLNGPIVTNIRALLTPQPLREMRVKSNYVHHKQVKAALGVKICAQDLDKAVAGSPLFVIGPNDDEDEIRELVMADLAQMLESVDKSGHGVCVQASTLGSLEALLSFLKDSKIPVSGINIGPIHKKDVVRASVMLEQAKEFAVILAFDVKIDRDVQELADELDVRIFKADIIYHLFDQFTAYMNALVEQKRKDMAPAAVFPCVLRIVPGCVFNKREPIILGVDVVDGVLRVGTPLAVPAQGGISIGRVTSIEANHKPLPEVRRGGPSVAIKIEHASYEPARMVGRHFGEKDELVSKISRASIDVLKENFRNDLNKEDWALVVKLKKVFNIQ
ncbi:Elongation factor, GTP-binding domain-containing protein [Paramicrosporidium saccamoebae]|uniref:Eukaryotic translation initiation factor 5B n=1 Tax=Paramicrosporidium saccamoebae TaxID=1246581 RepID=A0A2H9TK79_9FUNG|nr:Elongation factor, GTP-binding domain-containing protein [Paramicrosporidium saccamoebae]